MILTLLQYMIAEKCINILFDRITENFNSIPLIIINSINDFYIDQRFSSIYVIGTDTCLNNTVVIYLQQSTLYSYVIVRDDLNNRYAINSTDISSMRFYI